MDPTKRVDKRDAPCAPVVQLPIRVTAPMAAKLVATGTGMARFRFYECACNHAMDWEAAGRVLGVLLEHQRTVRYYAVEQRFEVEALPCPYYCWDDE